MNIEVEFSKLKTAFPKYAEFQGLHYKFASKNGVFLFERKRFVEELNETRYFYWLHAGDEAKLIHASKVSKLRSMKTVGDSFTPTLK